MSGEQSGSNQLDNALVKQLLTTVQTLQSDVADLKSGATGGSSTQLPVATLSQTDSAVHGKDLPVKRPRSEEGENSEEEPLSSDDEDDNVFTLTEVGSAFMEAAFMTKLNTASRKKKMVKLGMPDCRWIKSPELDSFVTSTIPKEVVRNDNTSQKTQRLWLKASSVLAAIVDRSDADKILDGEIIKRPVASWECIPTAFPPTKKGHPSPPKPATLSLWCKMQTSPRHHLICLGPILASWQRKDWKLRHSSGKQLRKLCRIFRSTTPRNSAPGAIKVAAGPPEAPAEKEVTLGGSRGNTSNNRS